jgi:hypothetical protein
MPCFGPSQAHLCLVFLQYPLALAITFSKLPFFTNELKIEVFLPNMLSRSVSIKETVTKYLQTQKLQK